MLLTVCRKDHKVADTKQVKKLARERKVETSHHEYTVKMPDGVNIHAAEKYSSQEHAGLYFPKANALTGKTFEDSDDVSFACGSVCVCVCGADEGRLRGAVWRTRL